MFIPSYTRYWTKDLRRNMTNCHSHHRQTSRALLPGPFIWFRSIGPIANSSRCRIWRRPIQLHSRSLRLQWAAWNVAAPCMLQRQWACSLCSRGCWGENMRQYLQISWWYVQQEHAAHDGQRLSGCSQSSEPECWFTSFHHSQRSCNYGFRKFSLVKFTLMWLTRLCRHERFLEPLSLRF